MEIYMKNEHFKGKVLYIYCDCSYSGSWVREAMAFMDEQGVGPCGHVAKEKDILLKILASCLPDEVPAELKFSIYGVSNDKNDGTVTFMNKLRHDKIYIRQHPSVTDFTTVQCKNKIDQPCTMAPGSTWERWNIEERTMIVTGKKTGRSAWQYVLLVDDEETIRIFKDKTREENEGVRKLNVEDYGQILKSGWGEEPPNDAKQWILDNYLVNYDYQPSSHISN